MSETTVISFSADFTYCLFVFFKSCFFIGFDCSVIEQRHAQPHIFAAIVTVLDGIVNTSHHKFGPMPLTN